MVEFDHFKMQAGRYGDTYAHKDIAFELGSVISPFFKLYLIKKYQRLKDVENNQQKIEWDAKRFLFWELTFYSLKQ